MGNDIPTNTSKQVNSVRRRLSLILQDVSYLLNRSYDKRRAIDFVASRYLLDRSIRNFIFRTLSSNLIADQTKVKLRTSEQLAGFNLGIDGFNILLTLREMIQRKPVYLCYDHVIRDISGNYGNFPLDSEGKIAIQTLSSILLTVPVKQFTVLLDEPVSHSGEIAAEMRTELNKQTQNSFSAQEGIKNRFEDAVVTVRSPDHELNKFDVVASHDSIVIERAKWIFDIPQHVATLDLFASEVIDVRALIQGLGEVPHELRTKLDPD
ncbi:MAG: DUF434 domain-containing protein [Candidatus Hodarchaeota archaeon]